MCYRWAVNKREGAREMVVHRLKCRHSNRIPIGKFVYEKSFPKYISTSPMALNDSHFDSRAPCSRIIRRILKFKSDLLSCNRLEGRKGVIQMD